MICELFGMDVSNASLYDAGTALAEAVILSRAYTKRSDILWSDSVNPDYRRVAKTLSSPLGLTYRTLSTKSSTFSSSELAAAMTDQTAAVIFQYPNFFGLIEDLREAIALVQSKGALAIVIADPMAMGLLEAPGKWGADIVIGEGQSLGNYQSYGGPFLGLFTAKQEYVRLIPGRIVGVTKDVDGRRGFVLTLQTREQHIRRDKATSNVCTNEGLIATRATFYLSVVGPKGLRELGEACMRRVAYLRGKLLKIEGIRAADEGPHFKEFVLNVHGGAEEFFQYMSHKNILAGVPLSRLGVDRPDDLLVAVTENRTQEEMDQYVQAAMAYRIGGAA
jgi:glycine dehydrogenase subunit 1